MSQLRFERVPAKSSQNRRYRVLVETVHIGWVEQRRGSWWSGWSPSGQPIAEWCRTRSEVALLVAAALVDTPDMEE